MVLGRAFVVLVVCFLMVFIGMWDGFLGNRLVGRVLVNGLLIN